MIRKLAFALVLAASLPSAAYVRSEDDVTGACFFWPTRNVHWTLNEKGAPNLPFASVESAVKRSFQTWQDVACSDMAFTYDGPTTRADAGFDPNVANNVNLVVWRDVDCDTVVPAGDACRSDSAHPFACANAYGCWQNSPQAIALTTVNYNRNTGVIVDADIEVNAAPESGFVFTTVDSPPCAQAHDPNCVSTDVQNTLTHEAGHFVGLAHPLATARVCNEPNPDQDATMCGTAGLGETTKRTLAQDDVDGLCAIYPAGKPPTTCVGSGSIKIVPAPQTTGCTCAAATGPGLLGLLALLRRRRRRARRRAGPDRRACS